MTAVYTEIPELLADCDTSIHQDARSPCRLWHQYIEMLAQIRFPLLRVKSYRRFSLNGLE